MMSLEEHLRLQMEYKQTFGNQKDIPVLDLKFPRTIRSMHQIEITSRCNLRCPYCPSHKMPKLKDANGLEMYPTVDGYRQQMDMTEEHFRRALHWVKHFVDRETQIEVNLAGIGESTMHPQFIDFVRLAREIVGFNDLVITVATNGLLITEAMARSLQPYNLQMWVSLHRPEKAGPAIQILKKYGLFVDVSGHPAVEGNTWAGQVDWYNSARTVKESSCMWQRHGFVMAMADGRITSCCLDAKGTGVVGHLDDPIPKVKQKPFELCKNCHQGIRVSGFDQYERGGL